MSSVPSHEAWLPPQPPGSEERQELRRLIRALSLRRGRFVLASGAISDVYLDLRLTTTHPSGARLAARFLLQEAARLTVNRLGGPTLGADPLVGAAVTLAPANGPRGFLVRAQAKDHGTGRQIEGHLEAGDRALVLDDVVTAGGSILRACEAVRAAGAEVAGSFCLVDRDQGGREKLAEAGAPLHALFRIDEILAEDPALSFAQEKQADGRVQPAPDSDAQHWHPETPALTVDAIIESVPGQVLLVARRHPPLGWALPGGFVDLEESAEMALRREVSEETGLSVTEAVQMHTYSGPGRDSRLRTASVVFVVQAQGLPEAGDDAAACRLFPLNHLPEDLCFDHRRILGDYLARRGVGTDG